MKYYLCATFIIAMMSFSCTSGKKISVIKNDPITFIADSSLFASPDSTMEKFNPVYLHFQLANGIREGSFTLNRNDTIKINIQNPIYITRLNSVGDRAKLYPGESVVVKSADDGSIQYTVYNKERNNELVLYNLIQNVCINAHYELFTKYYRNDSTKLLSVKVTEENMTAFLNNLSKNQQLLIDSSFTVYAPGMEFKKDIRFTLYTDSLTRRFALYQQLAEQSGLNGIGKGSLIQMFKTLDSISLSTDFSFLQIYTYLLFKQAWKGEEIISGNVRSKKDFIRMYKLANEYSSGKPRDYILSGIIYSSLALRIHIPSKYLKNYYRTCSTKEYKEEVRSKREQVQGLSRFKIFRSSNTLLQANSFQKTTIQDEIKKSRGKLLLIDLWASWCLPCAEQMPFLSKLEEDYKGKPFRIIKISTDKNIDAWKDGLSQKDIREGNNFVFLNASRSKFKKKHKVTTIPRYILIDKDGSIINDKAPSPHDPELKKLLEKFL